MEIQREEGGGRKVPRPKALIVDDDEAGRAVLHAMLDHLGMDAQLASGGAEAIGLFKPGLFAIIFLDFHMPDFTGEDVLRHIRLSEADRALQTPVMAYTADVAEATVERLGRLGFDGCLRKPIDLPTLQALMRGAADLNH